ncbi:MAG: metalloregulator ArsR/SmtB family transcription factor [Deltaproteobacteria bacterium]|nr:metalloregulator ArsR/SmtB family transcription factor [Deltaproteobacteria bacterium]
MTTKTTGHSGIYEMQAEICLCLANPRRLEIIAALKDGPLCSTVLAKKAGISKALASQHLAMMRDKGILTSRRDGKSVIYSLSSDKVAKACALMKEVLFEHMKVEQGILKKAAARR